MNETLNGLYTLIQERKLNPTEGSYTAYLFAEGLNKILKKCAEECGEVMIAAKDQNNADTASEICDLIYHLMVLMVQQGIGLDEVTAILEARRQKIGNLKNFHQTDKNT